jgi:hypothetical protein
MRLRNEFVKEVGNQSRYWLGTTMKAGVKKQDEEEERREWAPGKLKYR